MKTIVILAHPNIEHSRINKAQIEALKNSHPEIYIHNIYQAYADGKIDVTAEQNLLIQYDRIIFQYPFQWYNMPPLLKQWLDEVLVMGWAYGNGGDNMKDKEIGFSVSTAGLEEVYTDTVFGTVGDLLKPMESTIKFIGAKYISYHVFHGAYTPDVDKRLPTNIEQYLRFITQ